MRSSFEDRLTRFYPALLLPSGVPEGEVRIERVVCGEGWFPIIEMLCSAVQELIDKNGLPQPTITQIKEKFGLMRVTCHSHSEPVRTLIAAAERASGNFCEVCGEPGRTQRTKHGWIKTLCEGCAAAAQAHP